MDHTWMQGCLSEAVARYQVPGAQLGLLSRGRREVVCVGVLDVREPAPVLRETQFHAGSLTKALTGLVVLSAARDGALQLDTPCRDQSEKLWDATPRELLTQTSGMPNVLPDADEELAEFVARTAAMPRTHEPGRFSYSNGGWLVLDLLLQGATGRGFEQAADAAFDGALTFGRPAGAAAGHLCLPGRAPTPTASTTQPAVSAAGSRWWACADTLLDIAELFLSADGDGFHPEDVLAVRSPAARLPGSTVFDTWGMGWAQWNRGPHHAFGWAGYTNGHRAFLRCFPEHGAAVALLTNGAGSLFGPPGGSAVFDALLPDLLAHLQVPPLTPPAYPDDPVPADRLAGGYGPLTLRAVSDDSLRLRSAAFGVDDPIICDRLGGNTFAVAGDPPGSTPLAVDGDLLYLGPFALPRTG